MTSAQSWSRRHHLAWADVIHADFQRVISRYIQNISTCLSSKSQRGVRTIFIQKSKLKYACLPSKIVAVWIDVISVPSVLYGSQCGLVCMDGCFVHIIIGNHNIADLDLVSLQVFITPRNTTPLYFRNLCISQKALCAPRTRFNALLHFPRITSQSWFL